MEKSINILNINSFNEIYKKISPEYLEFKGNYFFRKENQRNFYEILFNELGDFLCVYTDLFTFKDFVVSHSPFRLYKRNKNYEELCQKYIEMFKNISAIFDGVKVKSSKHVERILLDNGYECYFSKINYPFMFWKKETPKISTLFIKKDGIKIKIPYYYASNFKLNILQNTIKKTISHF